MGSLGWTEAQSALLRGLEGLGDPLKLSDGKSGGAREYGVGKTGSALLSSCPRRHRCPSAGAHERQEDQKQIQGRRGNCVFRRGCLEVMKDR